MHLDGLGVCLGVLRNSEQDTGEFRTCPTTASLFKHEFMKGRAGGTAVSPLPILHGEQMSQEIIV